MPVKELGLVKKRGTFSDHLCLHMGVTRVEASKPVDHNSRYLLKEIQC